MSWISAVGRGGGSASGSSSDQSQQANNRGNQQNIRIDGDRTVYERPVTVAPVYRPTHESIGDISYPVPAFGGGAYAVTQPNGEMDYGVTVGITIPLGSSIAKDAAAVEAQRRKDRAQMELIAEALWLRDKGLLDEAKYPRHYAAIN